MQPLASLRFSALCVQPPFCIPPLNTSQVSLLLFSFFFPFSLDARHMKGPSLYRKHKGRPRRCHRCGARCFGRGDERASKGEKQKKWAYSEARRAGGGLHTGCTPCPGSRSAWSSGSICGEGKGGDTQGDGLLGGTVQGNWNHIVPFHCHDLLCDE